MLSHATRVSPFSFRNRPLSLSPWLYGVFRIIWQNYPKFVGYWLTDLEIRLCFIRLKIKMLLFEDLVRIYRFSKPVRLVIGEEQGVVATKREVVIYCPEDAMGDLAEFLALGKLGEWDHLLATFYFQRDLSEEEGRLARRFYELCMPLQTLWAWDIMRRHLTIDEFILQLREPLGLVYNVYKRGAVLREGEINAGLLIAFILIAEKWGRLAGFEFEVKMVGKYLDEYISWVNNVRRFSKLEPV